MKNQSYNFIESYDFIKFNINLKIDFKSIV